MDSEHLDSVQSSHPHSGLSVYSYLIKFIHICSVHFLLGLFLGRFFYHIFTAYIIFISLLFYMLKYDYKNTFHSNSKCLLTSFLFWRFIYLREREKCVREHRWRGAEG